MKILIRDEPIFCLHRGMEGVRKVEVVFAELCHSVRCLCHLLFFTQSAIEKHSEVIKSFLFFHIRLKVQLRGDSRWLQQHPAFPFVAVHHFR